MKASRLLGAVLAGGESRRLGTDKAAVTLDGDRLIDRTVSALRAHCSEIVVVSSRPDTPTGSWTVVEDRRSAAGPLAGIEAALLYCSEGGYDAAVVLAVDLPLVQPPAIEKLTEAFAGSGGRPVAAARSGDPDYEPLCAIYTTSCLGTVSRLLDDGERAARSLFLACGGSRVQGIDGADTNVNDARDLERAVARLHEGRT